MRRGPSLADYLAAPDRFPEIQMTGQRVRGRYDRVEAPLPRAARSGELSRMARSGSLAADARSGRLADIARAPGFQGYGYGDYTPPSPIPRMAGDAAQRPDESNIGWGPGLMPPVPVGPGGIYGGPEDRSALRMNMAQAQNLLPPLPADSAPPLNLPPLSTATHGPAAAMRPAPRQITGKDGAYLTDEEAWARALDYGRMRAAAPSKRGLFRLPPRR